MHKLLFTKVMNLVFNAIPDQVIYLLICLIPSSKPYFFEGDLIKICKNLTAALLSKANTYLWGKAHSLIFKWFLRCAS